MESYLLQRELLFFSDEANILITVKRIAILVLFCLVQFHSVNIRCSILMKDVKSVLLIWAFRVNSVLR